MANAMLDLRKVADSFSWPVYCRSYLTTLGGLLIGLCCLIAGRESVGVSAHSPAWQLGFGLALLVGVLLILVGLVGKSRTIEKWADSWSRHEIAFAIMLLALPLYFVLATFYRRR
jgi:hypothetical protein